MELMFQQLSIIYTVLWKLSVYAAEEKYCRSRERLVNSNVDDVFELVDGTLGGKITLQCHHCEDKDDGRPKIWYKMSTFEQPPSELIPDMKNNASDNRIHINNQHSLIFNSIEFHDTGIYYCKRYEEDLPSENYNYLIDLVFDDNSTTFETGNLTKWRQYYEEYFIPINALFTGSKGVEYRQIREEFSINMEMVSKWGPWSKCAVCGRPQNEGLRKKTGKCRIKLSHNHESGMGNETDYDRIFLKKSTYVSCRSFILARVTPGISNLTRYIPDFVQDELCPGTCNPDSEGGSKGWKTGKTSAFKYRKTYVLDQNSEITLICPESTMDNKVVWKKNGKTLKSGEFVKPPNPDEGEPRIMVDMFSTLYLTNIQESEEGNYTCFVDDIRMQNVMIYVKSKSALLTHTFVRYLIYLGFLLCLNSICYCAGLIIACSKKHTFKGYHELKELEEERRKRPYFGAAV